MTSNNIETTLNELLEMMKAYTERHSTSGIKMEIYYDHGGWIKDYHDKILIDFDSLPDLIEKLKNT